MKEEETPCLSRGGTSLETAPATVAGEYLATRRRSYSSRWIRMPLHRLNGEFL
jgi:hypothetical protein